MSHFVTIRTELREREHLIAALREFGLPLDEGDGAALPVHGDQRRAEEAEIVVHAGPGVDIGFRRGRDGYEVVADWYRVEQRTRLQRKDFLAELNRRYALSVVRAQAREQNLLLEEETLPNGDVVVTLSERA